MSVPVRNYPDGADTDVSADAAFYAGKSFSEAGGTSWPAKTRADIDVIKGYVGYRSDTVEDDTLTGRVAAVEALAGGLFTEDFSTLPTLDRYAVTSPDGPQFYDLSVASNELSITGRAGNTDNNLRLFLGLSRAGILGDSEVQSVWQDTSTNLGAGGDLRFQGGHVHRIVPYRVQGFTGQATSGGSTSLTMTGAGWTADQWHGYGAKTRRYFVSIIGGTGQGQTKTIVDNTTTALTVDSAWSTNPDATSEFEIWAWGVRGVSIMPGIVFGLHYYIQAVYWDNFCYSVFDSVDLSAYLKPGGTYVEYPWHVKSRVVGTAMDFAIWVEGDAPADYGDVGQSGSFTIPAQFSQPGESGLYIGHLNAGDVHKFKDLRITDLGSRGA